MDRRTLLRTAVAAPAALSLPALAGPPVAAAAATAPAGAAPRVTRTVARGLDVPWGIAFLPGGNALVSERDNGRILLVRASGGYRPVGDVPGVRPGGEGGLLGLALHPGFRRNRWVYAFLTTARDNRVVRMRYAEGRLGRPQVVLAGIPRALHHNGGGLAFGPDGHLYVSTGDAGRSGLAQDRRSLAGKILRVTPRGGVPAGNPFGNRVWSYGHRNPEQIAFGARGALWASEFGDDRRDELNRIVRGHNYGWPHVEGGDGRGGYHDPLAQWPPAQCSPSGIAVLAGWAWLGALRGECVYSVRLAGPRRGRVRRHFTGRFGRIRSVAATPDGGLWIATSNRDGRGSPARADDRILRVTLG